ncbi:MAG: biosynthetic-type acetolactate synthase large subunit [Bacteroidetes bacterium]|nr:biosynthetic-type acetolactate synthase large subunit [Bacteroidota bacterium]
MTPAIQQKVNGADAILKVLIKEGVETVFGYPGGAVLPLYDAIMKYHHKVHHVLVRHEQGAVHAAQGYSRATGKVGVCIVTSGPGATNIITGIADAMMDSTPLVCVIGQVVAPLLGTDAFQEADVIGLTMPITKWNYQITSADEIPEAMAKAFYIARSGRPGPVVLDVSKTAQIQEFDFHYERCNKIRSYVPVQNLRADKLKEAAELINSAKKPYLLFGNGIIISGAEKELQQFVEKTGIPAAWTLLGLSAMDTDHPLNVGMLGMHGNYGPNIKTNECDVLIAVGMRFDDRVTGDVKSYARQAKVIHIEIDPAEIDKIIKADVAILGDAKKALQKLIELVNPNKHDEWVNEFKECYKLEQKKVIKKDITPTKKELTMGEVVRLTAEKVNGDAIAVTDVGQQQMIASRYFKFKQSRSFISSGGLGTMGFGVPAAMGAKLGQPNRQVIAFVGDGGFQMTLQELGTISQYQIGVKIVILNNNYLGMVRQWQQLFFDKRYSFTHLQNPDFIKLAEAYSIKARKVTKREDLTEAISEMIDHQGPYLLEVVVEKEDNVFPMVPAGASVAQIILEP